MNRTPSPLAFQNPSPSSGQPYRPGGTQRLEIFYSYGFLSFCTSLYACTWSLGKLWSDTAGDGINQFIYFFRFDFFIFVWWKFWLNLLNGTLCCYVFFRSPGPVNGIQWGSEGFPRPSPSVRPYQFPGVQRLKKVYVCYFHFEECDISQLGSSVNHTIKMFSVFCNSKYSSRMREQGFRSAIGFSAHPNA